MTVLFKTTAKRFLVSFPTLLILASSCLQLEHDVVGEPTQEYSLIDVSKGERVYDPSAYWIELNNSYALEVMQVAYDSLCIEHGLPTVILDPTDVYVRFLPKDSLEFNALQALGTDFFDYPLTYEMIGEISSFRDPSVPDSLMTWQYTVVPIGTILPSTIQHEIIDTCYIPAEEPLRGFPENFNLQLEMLADSLANPNQYSSRISDIPTRGGSRPCGYVRMQGSGGATIPVRGVKVLTQRLVRIGSAYTNENGYYQMDKKFLFNPTYVVSFENSKGFSEYGTCVSLAPTWCGKGRHSPSGYNITIQQTESSWYSAQVNNFIVDYFDECLSENRTLPPSNMRIWLASTHKNWSGGAPMLRQIGNEILSELDVYALIVSCFTDYVAGYVLSAAFILDYFLPDIVIKEGLSSTDLQNCVYHELSHASHFATSGGHSFWFDVIAHMVRCYFDGGDLYGDGTDDDAFQDALELTEAWAYANERLLQWSKGQNVNAGDDSWFTPSIRVLYTLMRGQYSQKQISDLMTSSVDSIDDLCTAIISTYPNKRIWVTNLFANEPTLERQTIWRVQNNTSYSLIFSIRKGTTVTHTIVPINDYFVMSSIPAANKSFYATWYSPYQDYNPDEFFIRRTSDMKMLYRQTGNGNVITPLNRTFYYHSQWTHSTELLQIDPNTTELKRRADIHTFVLSNSDIL